MQNHQTSGVLFLHLYSHPPILSFNLSSCLFFFFIFSLFFSFHSHHSFICTYLCTINVFFLLMMNITFLMCIFNIYTPTLIFLHLIFSSLCSSSTNPMIRLENIVFLLGSKVLQISYTRKQVIFFNSGSKGFTKWIIQKIGLLVKQLTLMPLSFLCNYTYQCRLKQV